MRAVITVLGKDMVGILAKVSQPKRAEYDVNVIEVTQLVLQDLFAMIIWWTSASLPFRLTNWWIPSRRWAKKWALPSM